MPGVASRLAQLESELGFAKYSEDRADSFTCAGPWLLRELKAAVAENRRLTEERSSLAHQWQCVRDVQSISEAANKLLSRHLTRLLDDLTDEFLRDTAPAKEKTDGER